MYVLGASSWSVINTVTDFLSVFERSQMEIALISGNCILEINS